MIAITKSVTDINKCIYPFFSKENTYSCYLSFPIQNNVCYICFSYSIRLSCKSNLLTTTKMYRLRLKISATSPDLLLKVFTYTLQTFKHTNLIFWSCRCQMTASLCLHPTLILPSTGSSLWQSSNQLPFHTLVYKTL